MTSERYSDLLRQPEWADKRESIFRRDGFRCVMCGGTDSIQAHHLFYRGNPWDVDDAALATLCESCHGYIHQLADDLSVQQHQGASTLLQIIHHLARLADRADLDQRRISQLQSDVDEFVSALWRIIHDDEDPRGRARQVIKAYEVYKEQGNDS